MKLLLISNSTNAGEGYLEYPKEQLSIFCKSNKIKEAIFIPYAAVTYSYDEYETKVQKRFSDFNVKIRSVHNIDSPADSIKEAQCIIVGGGNTFMLVKKMQENNLMGIIKDKVANGTPYIGWSAGSNITCPTLCTTNDMPIVEPSSFCTLGLIPFQINPHYTDARLEGHGGETREQRILEYIAANPQMYVAGLREGCMILVDDDKRQLIGKRPLRIFKSGEEIREISSEESIDFLF